jgi:type III restriction enzyme
MSDAFFSQPILNSPYELPTRHWELDKQGQPTGRLIEARRLVDFVTPIPKPKKRRRGEETGELDFGEDDGLSTKKQKYDPTGYVRETRAQVDRWRAIKDPSKWRVTPETQRLLQHWRHHAFTGVRPFFCQVEAVETAIWLTEVAPEFAEGKRVLERLHMLNGEFNRDLPRVALKLATGAGKTTVMAMLIAWQTINAVRRPGSQRYSRGFLVVAPGITIRDRLRVLMPSDPESYYERRELVPNEFRGDLGKAQIVITNYHAFKRRETLEVSKTGRDLLQGRGPELQTLESEGQMLQRVMPELLGMKRVVVLNDEAHHCYREKPGEPEDEALKGDEKKDAEKSREAARLWISGIEAVGRKLELTTVFDLSATPFFLSGSGYAEGTAFPWMVSDFSLMDAIECGIVKLPRVPVADNIPSAEVPIYRELWKHIGPAMPKKGRGKSQEIDPRDLPPKLKTALEVLYGHYKRTFELWHSRGPTIPPCFIVVCNNTSTSKLVYDYISGFYRKNEDGSEALVRTELKLFHNFDEHGNALARPHTLLIDSEQLESGEALDKNFRALAADEIERFRKEIVQRTGSLEDAEKLSDQDLLREVMNTVGKQGRLGEQIRCVVSVAMLTEGWDANNVTHVLGVRAFGTQLLCEQVIGRALRRRSYELNPETGLFDVEYADVLGIPFDFTAKPVVSPPQPLKETILVQAVSPERDGLEIRFPRVLGYRVELPPERLQVRWSEEARFVLTPEDIGPTQTRTEGIVGEGVDLTLAHTAEMRPSALIMHLTKRLLYGQFRDPDGNPKLGLFGQLKRFVAEWIDRYLVCKGGTYPAQMLYPHLSEMACERIRRCVDDAYRGEHRTLAVLDPYNPSGSTASVHFTTTKTLRWKTSEQKSHVNWVIGDSDWELELCRVLESHPRVRAYVKNQGLGFEVPYRHQGEARRYLPDFLVLLDDGRPPKDGAPDFLHLVLEVKGYRREDVNDKSGTMKTYWVPGVNNLGTYGRWTFAEFGDVYAMEAELGSLLEKQFAELVERQLSATSAEPLSPA